MARSPNSGRYRGVATKSSESPYIVVVPGDVDAILRSRKRNGPHSAPEEPETVAVSSCIYSQCSYHDYSVVSPGLGYPVHSTIVPQSAGQSPENTPTGASRQRLPIGHLLLAVLFGLFCLLPLFTDRFLVQSATLFSLFYGALGYSTTLLNPLLST